MEDLKQRGSETAKQGFITEKNVADKFNNWNIDIDAQEWLKAMQYKLEEIEYVEAEVLHGFKADVNVQIKLKLKNAVDTENLQVKLVSNNSGFNQVDKRWLKSYKELWNIPDDVFRILQYFTGELPPYKNNTKDSRRMFFFEMEQDKQNLVLEWFCKNKMLILTDIIKGRGQFSAEWIIVIQVINGQQRWVLKNINEALQHYSQGEVRLTPQGSLKIGLVGMQRKGGDGGRETAKMLQFKLDPTTLFN